MKKTITSLALVLMLSCGLFAQETLLTAWTFDNLEANPNTPLAIASNSDIGAQLGTAFIYADGTNGSDALASSASSPQITSFGGSVMNDPREPAIQGNALAIANSTTNGKSIVFKFSTTGYQDIKLSFAIRGTASGYNSHVWSYSTNGTSFTTIDDNNTASRETTFSIAELDLTFATEINDQANVYLKLTVDGATSGSGNNRIDNIQIKASPAGDDVYPPRLTSCNVASPTSVKLTFNEALNGTIAQTAANYTFASSHSVSTATLSDNRIVTLTVSPELVEGESYTLTIKNIKDLADNQMGDSTFTFAYGIGTEYHKATIAELRALAPAYSPTGATYGDVVYKFSGEAVITYTITNRNQKYIQDNTGAILIDDQNGVMANGFAMGDKITAVYGTLSNYYGMIQFVPTQAGTSVDWGVQPTPEVAPLTDFDHNYENAIQAKLIRVEGVKFTETGTFATARYYALQQNNVTYDSIVFTTNYNADYISAPIPTYVVSLTGVVNYSYGKNRLVILNNSGIVSTDDMNMSMVRLSPNPAIDYVKIMTSDPQTIEIYSVSGQLISTQSCDAGDHIIPVSHFAKGLYIVKLTNRITGATQPVKLIVQ